jgi:hypothetical protein
MARRIDSHTPHVARRGGGDDRRTSADRGCLLALFLETARTAYPEPGSAR